LPAIAEIVQLWCISCAAIFIGAGQYISVLTPQRSFDL